MTLAVKTRPERMTLGEFARQHGFTSEQFALACIWRADPEVGHLWREESYEELFAAIRDAQRQVRPVSPQYARRIRSDPR